MFDWTATAGSHVIKPRRVVHSFWNKTDTDAHYIELSGRQGFEGFVDSTRDGSAKAALHAEERFGVKFIYKDIPRLMKEHGLTSIVGMERLELPDLPDLPKLPGLRR